MYKFDLMAQPIPNLDVERDQPIITRLRLILPNYFYKALEFKQGIHRQKMHSYYLLKLCGQQANFTSIYIHPNELYFVVSLMIYLK